MTRCPACCCTVRPAIPVAPPAGGADDEFDEDVGCDVEVVVEVVVVLELEEVGGGVEELEVDGAGDDVDELEGAALAEPPLEHDVASSPTELSAATEATRASRPLPAPRRAPRGPPDRPPV